MTDKNKRVCVIIPTHWEARMGGSQYQSKVLVDKLLKEGGYDIFFLASRVDPDFRPEGYQIKQIADRKGLRRYAFFFDSLRLLKLLTEIKPDIIYQRVGCAYTGVAAYYANKYGCKMIWQIAHDRNVLPFEKKLSLSYPFKFIDRKFLEYGIRHAKKIVAQTEYQQQLLGENFHRDAEIIPNFHPKPDNEINKATPLAVVWIANLKSWKRPEVFVRLAKDLSAMNNIKFVMIGKNMGEEGEYDALLNEVKIIDNLTYMGEQKQEKVNEILDTAHVFINTSLYEGFPNTFIQAWMRKVVVVSLSVDPDSVLSKKRIGIFADSDYDEMKEQTVMLLENENLRTSMGERSQEYAFSAHSDANITRLVSCF